MFRLDELVARLGGELVGEGATVIRRVASLEGAGTDGIAFLANPKYGAKLATTRAAAVIVPPGARDGTTLPRIVSAEPYLYFARVSQLLNPSPAIPAGVHPSAQVSCDLPASVAVGPCAVVEEGVSLGEGVVIGAGCYVGRGTVIGAQSHLHANVSIYHDCRLGERCLVHSGAVIGADGFGFARERDGTWVKIPQIGRVVIGDDVEIGANTAIDRGALDDTVIGNGAKIDNLVQVAHNVQIGEKTAIAGSAGIAGSAKIGARCMLGGQVGVTGHLEIGDDIMVSGCTMVSKTIKKPGVYTGNLPLQTHAEWIRNFSHLRHLDDMAKKIRQLEKQLADSKAN